MNNHDTIFMVADDGRNTLHWEHWYLAAQAQHHVSSKPLQKRKNPTMSRDIQTYFRPSIAFCNQDLLRTRAFGSFGREYA